ARFVAVLVVGLLEPVDVRHDDGHRRTAGPLLHEGGLEALLDEPSGAEARERVVVGEPLDPREELHLRDALRHHPGERLREPEGAAKAKRAASATRSASSSNDRVWAITRASRTRPARRSSAPARGGGVTVPGSRARRRRPARASPAAVS